jgi:hypothetical protein
MLKNKNQKTKELKNQRTVFQFFCFSVLLFFSSSVLLAQEQIAYDAGNRRDPFISLVTADGRLLNLEPQGQQRINLEGIVFDKAGSSYAIVNSKVVEVGDTIGDYQVYKIEQERVLFLKNGAEEIIELKLKKEAG